MKCSFVNRDRHIFARGFVKIRDTNAFGDRIGVAFANGGIIEDEYEAIDVLEYVDGFFKLDGVNCLNECQVFFTEFQCVCFMV